MVFIRKENEVAQSYPTFATPWTVACQAPLSVEFSRRELWSWWPFPTPGDLPRDQTTSCVFCIGRWILYHLPSGKPKVAQSVKNPPTVQGTRVQSLGWEDPLEKEMAAVHGVTKSWTQLSDQTPK